MASRTSLSPRTLPIVSQTRCFGPIFSADAAGENQCGICFCERVLHVNCDETPDAKHGVHDDVQLACFDSSLGPCMYLVAVSMNLSFMHWGDGRFGEIIRAGASEYFKTMTHECFLFRASFEHFLFEKQLQSIRGDEHLIEEVWSQVEASASFKISGSKVGICRFFQLFKLLVAFVEDWHAKLLVRVWVSLSEDCMSAPSLVKLAGRPNLRGLPGSAADTVLATRQSSADEIRALRQACNNSFQ